MSRPAEKPAPATLADFLAIPEDVRFHEIVDGELVQKAQPSPRHGRSQTGLIGVLWGPYSRRPGGPPDRPGGWWFITEPEVLFSGEPLRPDVAGWRRERLPDLPADPLLAITPDWVCEILSDSNATNDTVRKKRIYHRHRVPHYWIIDPRDETLTIYRWGPDGYIEVLIAQRGERVRAEPFEAVDLQVGVFFGEDDEDPSS